MIDNASKQDEASTISEKYPHVKVIRSPRNLGFAGGNNLGIKEAKGKYILLINNDTYFKEYNIAPLIERLESSDKIGIVCPKLRFAWGSYPIQFAGYTLLSQITVRNQAIGFGEEDKGQYDCAHPTPYAHGAAMLIKREAINKVGLMPECFFLYYEEIDWSMMFTRAGYEIWYDPACTVYHKESQTTGQNSPLRTYYITRNRLLLVKRNYKGINKYLSYMFLRFSRNSRHYQIYIPKQIRFSKVCLPRNSNFQFSTLNCQLKNYGFLDYIIYHRLDTIYPRSRNSALFGHFFCSLTFQ